MNWRNITLSYWFTDQMTSDEEGLRVIKSLPYLSVVQSVRGSYEIGLDGSPRQSTGEGGFFVAPAFAEQDIVHHVRDGLMHMRWLFIEAKPDGLLPIDRLYTFPMTVKAGEIPELNAAFDSLFSEQSLCRKLAACYIITDELLKKGCVKKAPPHELTRVLEYIDKNYSSAIPVAELAACAGVSESTFYSLFRSATGKTPAAYIDDVRLSKASAELIATSDPIDDIAERNGFYDRFHFGKRFAAKFGVPPARYRKIRAGF